MRRAGFERVPQEESYKENARDVEQGSCESAKQIPRRAWVVATVIFLALSFYLVRQFQGDQSAISEVVTLEDEADTYDAYGGAGDDDDDDDAVPMSSSPQAHTATPPKFHAASNPATATAIQNRCPAGSTIHLLFPHVNKAGGRTMEATFSKPSNKGPVKYLYKGPRSRTHKFKFSNSHRSYTLLARTFGWEESGPDASSVETTSDAYCRRWMFGLREPVGRMVSGFYTLTGRPDLSPAFMKTSGERGKRRFSHFYCEPKSKASELTKNPDATIEEWAQLPAKEREKCAPSFNLHVKYLAPEFPDDTPEQLEAAKKRLDSISWFYIIERLQESWQLFSYVFGTDFITYTPTFNLNKYPKDLSDKTLAILREHNKHDIELYEYALKLFEEKVRLMKTDPMDEFFKPFSFECDPKQICWSTLAAALVALLVAVFVGPSEAARKRRSRKSKADIDASNFYSGVTPSGSTKWKSESKGVIYTTIDTSHLGFDRVPKYFCSVVDAGRGASSRVNATIISMESATSLANVTGKYTPARPTNAGFRVRLKFKPEVGRDLSETDARIGGWRVRWAAVSEPHSSFEAAREFVENEKYETGIEDKPVGEALAYIELLKRLAVEDTQMVQSILGSDFIKPASKRPKPAKTTKPKQDAEASAEEGTAAESANAAEDAASADADASSQDADTATQ
ncbi:Heparan-sulfate 6-O-sulfotransferase 3 [Hondaea fermentalgiana]|uniref:Heparan-sulfate 6-O-sulfotransferase 3 n=1 Tax=Hondaea fermentalgiana TaxID=2315210 RepID=A0A2R5G7S4_9STRA|nr:Heparan-sulfate 6-O-sulfotransferase 3 [Hondaea fermentalgiana]|eukprot:GBG27087.1 Heparan-sulfate 6-O-sulfotransferase 3 [Hondaea fermentalgiana]